MVDINDYDLFPRDTLISDALVKNEALKEKNNGLLIVLGAIAVGAAAYYLIKWSDKRNKDKNTGYY
jgi:hypothetical protein